MYVNPYISLTEFAEQQKVLCPSHKKKQNKKRRTSSLYNDGSTYIE